MFFPRLETTSGEKMPLKENYSKICIDIGYQYRGCFFHEFFWPIVISRSGKIKVFSVLSVSLW
jgi:hypothetical protein